MYKKIVVKIGTKVLTKDERLNKEVVGAIVKEVAALRAQGVDVVVITSGAVATGKSLLPGSESERQVYAAVGQIGLMSLYAQLFGEHGYQCAQILVTKGDFRDKQHYANMKLCFENLLREKIIPVVNENDAISTPDLVFTDNDELAGLIASQIDADAVLFLTSVDGVLMSADGKGEEVVPEIREEDIPSFEKHVSDTKSSGGRGGMRTKFTIAKRLMTHGITVYVANGTKAGVITDIAAGKAVGTTFVPTKKQSAVKRRLAYSDGLAVGSVYVDQGAEKILLSKKSASLLPVGILKLEGNFKKGDTIEIRSEAGKKLGFGVAQYGAEEARPLLGKKGASALVHYNYMVIGE